jgi:glycosyltransferase involved in cell wall biosynthesis
MNKKLLFITNEYPTKVATFVSRDMIALVENGYEIDIYSFYPKKEEYWKFVPKNTKQYIDSGQIKVCHIDMKKDFVKILKNFSSINTRKYFTESISILKDSYKFGISNFIKTIYVLMWTKILGEINQENNYQAVISYWANYSATSAYMYRKYFNTRLSFITYAHAGVDLYREQTYLLNKFLDANKIITVCQYNVEFIKKLFPNDFEQLKDKISVYHLPVEIDNNLDGYHKKSNKIIAVGRLDKKKGLDYLIRACEILKQSSVNFQLEIIGDGPQKQYLVDLVQKYSLDSKILFSGHLPYEQVLDAMKSSTVLAHCSPEIGDAVPTVIKESLSVGTPVVASNIAGIPELLDYGKCGIIFEPKNVEQLANALKNILEDKQLQKKLSADGKKFAEKMFSFDKNKYILSNIIKSTIKEYN